MRFPFLGRDIVAVLAKGTFMLLLIFCTIEKKDMRLSYIITELWSISKSMTCDINGAGPFSRVLFPRKEEACRACVRGKGQFLAPPAEKRCVQPDAVRCATARLRRPGLTNAFATQLRWPERKWPLAQSSFAEKSATRHSD